MSFELRIGGRSIDRFESSDDAETRAKELVRENADIVVEIIDLSTGRPYAPAAGAGDRDALAGKIGF
ncbi:hypothetical protein [Rhodopila sp.]|uniref:hypothetical protein n=1 Tax=Rhodopila sp. TaxID=2480087 RepID=UPI003D1240E6